MNITKIKNRESGFILYITLIMLIIFAIIGISLYQQTSLATVTVQYVTFKQEAEDLSLKAIDYLEKNIDGSVTKWNGNELAAGNRRCYQYIAPGANPNQPESDKAKAERLFACNAIPSSMVNEAVSSLKSGRTPSDYKPPYVNSSSGALEYGESTGSWSALGGTTGFSGNGTVYYIIQNLGLSDDDSYQLYRITVLAAVLDSYSSMDSIYAVAQPI